VEGPPGEDDGRILGQGWCMSTTWAKERSSNSRRRMRRPHWKTLFQGQHEPDRGEGGGAAVVDDGIETLGDCRRTSERLRTADQSTRARANVDLRRQAEDHDGERQGAQGKVGAG